MWTASVINPTPELVIALRPHFEYVVSCTPKSGKPETYDWWFVVDTGDGWTQSLLQDSFGAKVVQVNVFDDQAQFLAETVSGIVGAQVYLCYELQVHRVLDRLDRAFRHTA